ncbi:MAG: hypothetical protein Q4G34_01575 [Micrococcus sp.]|nr:hypothetical protein [Micrococcus sp.]
MSPYTPFTDLAGEVHSGPRLDRVPLSVSGGEASIFADLDTLEAAGRALERLSQDATGTRMSVDQYRWHVIDHAQVAPAVQRLEDEFFALVGMLSLISERGGEFSQSVFLSAEQYRRAERGARDLVADAHGGLKDVLGTGVGAVATGVSNTDVELFLTGLGRGLPRDVMAFGIGRLLKKLPLAAVGEIEGLDEPSGLREQGKHALQTAPPREVRKEISRGIADYVMGLPLLRDVDPYWSVQGLAAQLMPQRQISAGTPLVATGDPQDRSATVGGSVFAAIMGLLPVAQHRLSQMLPTPSTAPPRPAPPTVPAVGTATATRPARPTSSAPAARPLPQGPGAVTPPVTPPRTSGVASGRVTTPPNPPAASTQTPRLDGGLAAVVRRLDRSDAPSSAVSIDRVRADDGTETYIVSLPGSDFGSRDVWNDQIGLADAMGRDSVATGHGVAQALSAAGVPAGARIMLVGHSQGGMHATNLTRHAALRSQYSVVGALSVGSPARDMKAASDVPILHLEDSSDLVTGLDGGPNPSTAQRATITVYSDPAINATRAVEDIVERVSQHASWDDITSDPELFSAVYDQLAENGDRHSVSHYIQVAASIDRSRDADLHQVHSHVAAIRQATAGEVVQRVYVPLEIDRSHLNPATWQSALRHDFGKGL